MNTILNKKTNGYNRFLAPNKSVHLVFEEKNCSMIELNAQNYERKCSSAFSIT